MPHVPDVLATSHDHHDPIVVAAFAAGDLAGTERDQALALTDSCPDCAALLADLRAIARATAALPPPVRSAGRDFRITPEQAARLDRTGWRRLVPGRPARPSVARPLGVALATFGLMGLLIGNVSFGSLGGASSAGTAVTSGAAANAGGASGKGGTGTTADQAAPEAAASLRAAGSVAFSAASAAAGSPRTPIAAGSAAPPAASDVAIGDTGASAAPVGNGAGQPGAAAVGSTASPAVPGTADGRSGPAVESSPLTPLNVISIAAVIAGLALLIAARGRRRASV